MAVIAAMFAIIMVIVFIMVIVSIVALVMNDDGSSMMAMVVVVMINLHWNPDSYVHMDLDHVRSCRFRRGELSHSHCQCTKED